jgi:flavin-binding protein dodecin
MGVEKSIDLVATGPSIDEAIAEAVHRASLTLKGITSFVVSRVEGRFDNGEISYRVYLQLSFELKERIHE